MGTAGPATAFGQVIAPLDPAGFAVEVWERASMVFPGRPERFAGLGMNFARFATAIGTLAPGSIRANWVEPDGTGNYVPVAAADCRRCYEQGRTICVTGLDQGVPELADLARDTRRTMGLAGAVGVNAYLSPAGRGFGLHFDMQSVFILQIEGEKRWVYGTRPAASAPPEAMDAYPDRERAWFRARFPDVPLTEPEATEWQQCLLRPGDALYLPPGTWHRGVAGTYSLALTLTCCPRSFASLLTPLLQGGLLMREPWRRNLPCRVAAADARSSETFIADRLAELRHWAADVSAADLARLWDGVLSADAPSDR